MSEYTELLESVERMRKLSAERDGHLTSALAEAQDIAVWMAKRVCRLTGSLLPDAPTEDHRRILLDWEQEAETVLKHWAPVRH